MKRKSKHGTQLDRVLLFVIKEQYITWPIISRKLQIGYLGAQQIIKQLESTGYVSKMDKSNIYKVIRHINKLRRC